MFKEFLIATPFYIVIIGIEIIASHIHDRPWYSLRGTIENIWLSALNIFVDLCTRAFSLAALGFFFQQRTLVEQLPPAAYWLVLVLAEDFAFYWLHRVDHHCRLFWAMHVTHHSSEEFNFTVGFRSSVFQPVYRFLYFIPLAFAGFHPLDIYLVYSMSQLYGILIHTRSVQKLGVLEHILVTPSHHRVHHASNPIYLDRNLGMVFIVWDKLFGTFIPETEEVRYGLTTNLKSRDPFNVIFHEWKEIVSDQQKSTTWSQRLKYIFGPPGWSHDGSRKTSDELRTEHESRPRTA